MADQRVYARTFSQTLTLVAGLFCLEKRLSYRRLRKEFDLDDEILNDRRADIGFPGSRLRARHPGRPWFGTLYGPPEVTGDQMVAASVLNPPRLIIVRGLIDAVLAVAIGEPDAEPMEPKGTEGFPKGKLQERLARVIPLR